MSTNLMSTNLMCTSLMCTSLMFANLTSTDRVSTNLGTAGRSSASRVSTAPHPRSFRASAPPDASRPRYTGRRKRCGVRQAVAGAGMTANIDPEPKDAP